MSYDRIDWHLDSAVEAGRPEEQAFAHIGLYLAWVIRHDLHDPRMFPSDHIDAVTAGEMTGSDLADDIDGKLVADVMSSEGKAFSDAQYEAYLDEYERVFADLPDYGVVDGPTAYREVERILDQMYADWVSAGRQPPKAEQDLEDLDLAAMEQVLMVPPGFNQAEIDELLTDIPGEVRVITRDLSPPQHAAPELEALIPDDLTSPPMAIDSTQASEWRSSLLARALKRLGVAPKDATVAHGIGGNGEGTLTVTLYRVPGIDAERLTAEFRSVMFRIPGSNWESRTIGGRNVLWAAAEEFTVAFWARDGMVFRVAGQPDVVIPAIDRLP